MTGQRMVPLVIRKVGDRGLGVVATAGVKLGARAVGFYGKPRWIWEIPSWCWGHSFQVDYDRYVVPAPGSFGWCINHSCDPNCVVRGERELVALRDINAGEEVTFDYSTNVGWDGYSLSCRCGTRNCRGMILSYGRLSEELKKRYGSRVSPYLLRPQKRQRPSLFWRRFTP